MKPPGEAQGSEKRNLSASVWASIVVWRGADVPPPSLEDSQLAADVEGIEGGQGCNDAARSRVGDLTVSN